MAAAAAAAEPVFREVEVVGDGNCFYRALYKTAKYHPDKDVFGHVLDCFDIKLGPAAGAGAGGHAETDKVEEDKFVTKIRDSLADKVAAGISKQMKAAGEGSTYEAWHEAAAAALGGADALWNTLIDQASEELAAAFPEPEIMLSMDEEDFNNIIASIIRKESVYASEMDYRIIKFLLAQCRITLRSADLRPDRPENVANLAVDLPDGSPVLIVRRMRALDHYRAFIAEKQYLDNKDRIFPKGKRAEKVTMSKLRKTAKAKAASKSKRKSKSKGAAAAASNSSNNNINNNLAAAMEASMKNMYK